MKPTPYIVIPRPMVPYPLEGIEQYYFGEKFVPVIYYDATVLPYYYISNYGRLYSCRYRRLISQYLDQGGYYRVNITLVSGKTCFTGVHKLELMSFYPILESSLYVPNHKDGIKINNFIGNLEWVTISENTRHALDTGLANYKCENNSRSYLSNQTVHHICKMMEDGCSNTEILNDLGYDFGKERNRVAAILRQIHRGQTYLDIGSQYDIPGLKGVQRYGPEMTMEVCKYLTDGNDYDIEEFCDIFDIKLEDRKLFRNYIDDVCKGNTDTYITKPIKHLIKRPTNVSTSHRYYNYYN